MTSITVTAKAFSFKREKLLKISEMNSYHTQRNRNNLHRISNNEPPRQTSKGI